MGRRTSGAKVGLEKIGLLSADASTLRTTQPDLGITISPTGTGTTAITSNTDITGTLGVSSSFSAGTTTINGNTILLNQNQLRLRELNANGSNSFGMRAASNMTADYTVTWPAAVSGTTGFVLSSDTSGNLSWVSAAGQIAVGDPGASAVVHYPFFGTNAGAIPSTLAPQARTNLSFVPSTGELFSTIGRHPDVIGSTANSGTIIIRGTSSATKATASVRLTDNVASTSTATGTLVVTGGIGASGNIFAGGIQNTPIGGTTRSSGAFTTLTSNAATTFTANTASTTTGTGTLVVTGGIGVSGQVTAATLSGNHSGGSGSFTTLAANSTVTFSGTTTAIDIGTSLSSGAITLGGTSQTGTIQVGRSTSAHSINVSTGAQGSGVTKTINIGTGGQSGSTTNITLGSTTAGAVGNIIFGHGPTFKSTSSGTDATTYDIDARQFTQAAWITSFAANRTLRIANLTTGRAVWVYLRNTNAAARTITVQASTAATYGNVNMSPASAGAASVTGLSLAAGSGTAMVLVMNINGNIVGAFH